MACRLSISLLVVGWGESRPPPSAHGTENQPQPSLFSRPIKFLPHFRQITLIFSVFIVCQAQVSANSTARTTLSLSRSRFSPIADIMPEYIPRWGEYTREAFSDLHDHLEQYEGGEDVTLSESFGGNYSLYAQQARTWMRSETPHGAVYLGFWSKFGANQVIERIRSCSVNFFNKGYVFLYFQNQLLQRHVNCPGGHVLWQRWRDYQRQ